MLELRFTNAAEQDLLRIAEFGRMRFGGSSVNVLIDRFEACFAQIREFPNLAPVSVVKGYRRSVVSGYSVYYRHDTEVIVIVRILGSEDPTNL